MKDMLKSKGLMIFVFVVLGVILIDSSINVKFEEKVDTDVNDIVMVNIK